MLKDCVPAHPEIHTEYYLVFDDGHGNGFWFPCNHKGAFAKPLSPCAQRNYDDCLQNPHRFVRYNEVVKEVRHFTAPASGKCRCGNTVELIDEYCGASQCQQCGQWYNLFGENILPPSEWCESCNDY